MGKLEGKNVLITGGTSGIGEAAAILFAHEGANTIIVGRNKEKGEAVVKKILENGGEAQYMHCDVTSESSVCNLKKQFENKYDHLDVLMNSAGVLMTSPLETIDEREWCYVFDANTHSIMRMTKAFINLVLQCGGNILNIASNVGMSNMCKGRANYAYAASKAATIKFTEQLALNYTPLGIRVNCLCPGTTETPIFTNKDFSRFNESIPMGRVGQPNEIAKAALFLVSDDASYVSGAVLAVDGAASLK